ncbi:MAG: D-amino acid aminotransferase [Gammaproteobacteria bacterium]|nr:D-amino acid aminotransferase [Gammaproteobacteria bacterium]
MTVFLNGAYLPLAEAKISVLDRGFIFSDGVYEVIPIYNGRLFRLHQHLQRLQQSLNGIRLDPPLSPEAWQEILTTLVAKNGGGDLSLYLQITRGPAPRDHRFPEKTEPTLFAMTQPLPPIQGTKGIAAITVEDIRWKLCQIKSIALLPNILLRQQAVDEGCGEAIMIRDNEVTEGAASNLFLVNSGVVMTPPNSNLILPGITRDIVIELCQRHQIPYEVRAIDRDELHHAEEIWVTSSTKELVPVTALNHTPVGDGNPGPRWQQLSTLYQQYKQSFIRGEAD